MNRIHALFQLQSVNRGRRLLSVALLLIIILIAPGASAQLRLGADRTEFYVPLLRGKRVGLLSNHTGVTSDGTHVLDVLRREGVDVRVLFSPEHGFRGTADAGRKVASSVDQATGLPIVSLYGHLSTPLSETLRKVDVIVCDLQDVGLRFYTYYITMMRLMEAAADSEKRFMVLDRPNPNGMTVDGPLLDMSLASGVGKIPVPVVHGMTMGELARMIVGEKWLKSPKKLDLTVVPCEGYTHQTRYKLPVAPSPNLPDMKAIYLYPSTCLFEGTVMSLGRGTEIPFTVYGHPSMTDCDFSFIPTSRPGATNPPLKNRKCYGRDLRDIDSETVIARGFDLSYIIDAYRNGGMKRYRNFFTPFFDKLVGNRQVRQMILDGKSADEIHRTWAADVIKFRRLRQPYLLYPE